MAAALVAVVVAAVAKEVRAAAVAERLGRPMAQLVALTVVAQQAVAVRAAA